MFVATFFFQAVKAQENSPFNRYGLGEFYNNQHIISRSMGGLTAAYSDGLHNNVGQSVNFGNPATYGGLYMSTFDIGVTIDSRTLYSKNPSGKFNSANFIPSYVAVGVPLNRTKGWGLAFGLKPLSRINYSVQDFSKIGADSVQTLYNGSGGLNQVFVGLGKRWKNFQIGFNTGYNFGRKEVNTTKNFLNDSVLYHSSKTSTLTTFGGMFLSAGAQYEVTLHSRVNTIDKTTEHYKLRFGVTGTLKQTMSALQDQDRHTLGYTSGGEIKIDSVLSQNDIKGSVVLPAQYAAGVTLHKTATNSRGVFELWSIGLEYTGSQWTGYRFYGAPDQLSNSWQYKLGVQFAPDPLASRGYWNAVNYRAGVYLGKDYLNPDGKGLKQYGVSFGAGLPIRKWTSYNDQFTVMNMALQFGKRGSSVNNVTETYMQFSLGISMSDIWFVKRKYD
ncbi:hypothetical protein [Sediminibacterium soli]|uniref:hypothetical protein n=1 Tax=Sediminibacterium soli TaxID=2698829 RepID=UPI001379EF52|nr:hypothetical protein [Sediminibacterium soli]